MTGLVLINGLPGSGKSTLARELAAALELPLYSKDAYKESLWAFAQPPDAAESSALGRQALEQMWAGIAATAGPVVVESFWLAPRDVEFLRADLRNSGRTAAAELWCVLDPATARRRCRNRERHPVHHAAHDDDEAWSRWARQAAPLGLGPVLEVNTESPVDVSPLCRKLEPLLGTDRPAPGRRP